MTRARFTVRFQKKKYFQQNSLFKESYKKKMNRPNFGRANETLVAELRARDWKFSTTSMDQNPYRGDSTVDSRHMLGDDFCLATPKMIVHHLPSQT